MVLCLLSFVQISFSQDKEVYLLNNPISLQDTTLANEYLNKGKTLFETQYDSSYFYYGKAKEIYKALSKQYD